MTLLIYCQQTQAHTRGISQRRGSSLKLGDTMELINEEQCKELFEEVVKVQRFEITLVVSVTAFHVEIREKGNGPERCISNEPFFLSNGYQLDSDMVMRDAWEKLAELSWQKLKSQG